MENTVRSIPVHCVDGSIVCSTRLISNRNGYKTELNLMLASAFLLDLFQIVR